MRSRTACLLILLAGLSSSCGNVDFTEGSVLNSVRILASKTDKPYAGPGETVKVELLTWDGRIEKPRPLTTYWIPIVCINPREDLYYACFEQFAGATVPGAGGGGTGGVTLEPGVDLTPYLPAGPEYSFTLPNDIVTSHPRVQGAVPYGMAVVFNIACAGHVELVARDSKNPQAVPFGCFDENRNRLGPDQYVIGFSRVYGYDTLRNVNPTIADVFLENQRVDLAQGITVDRCTTKLRRDCPDIKINVVVPETSWEVQDGDRREQIWAAYYADIGQLDGESRLLWDATKGRVDGSENKYKAANDPLEGTMFIVVHDNRGGTAWAQVPVHTR
ncbi:hypothetical protein LVJ94_36010 [Pendulispora rubella]|uniref:Uncharacterized protein n=1 Tax=Pendulispora rubella TaxID=2741070 RepID=A0ABZ2KZA2_9BACT